jgi:hypothetical protein
MLRFLASDFSPEFLLTSLVVAVIPGTGVVYTISNSITGGWRRGWLAAVGCTLGIVPHLLARRRSRPERSTYPRSPSDRLSSTCFGSRRFAAGTTPRLEGLVFYGERGGLVRRHVFRPVWDRAWKAAGLESIRPEWLRHTGASLAYADQGHEGGGEAPWPHVDPDDGHDLRGGLRRCLGRVADAIDRLVRESTEDS